ncbi:MAG: DUF72 domain-containing protein [bacterium]
MSPIQVGACGYGYYNAPEGWKDKYESKLQAFTHDFELLEVQKTFYDLPQPKTCRRWRENANSEFTFTLKAWQALTHTIDSPTWRGNDDQLTDVQREQIGYLRPNQTVKTAWSETMERAKRLDAEVIVLQCPASFEPTDENEAKMRALLSEVDRNGRFIAWESRGKWLDQPDRVGSICKDLNLAHTVDLMRRQPAHLGSVAYVRLHGLNEDRYDYDYDYSQSELKILRDRLHDLEEKCEKVYCLFNNFSKFKNIKSLKKLL